MAKRSGALYRSVAMQEFDFCESFILWSQQFSHRSGLPNQRHRVLSIFGLLQGDINGS